MSLKISIIIPVYNCGSYLERCLNSLINQDLEVKEYEIITINDGSKDNSLEVLKRYKLIMPNLIVLNQDNQGVSVARNCGIRIARGEYILFIDGDDTLHLNCLNDLYNLALENKLDLLYLNIDDYDYNGVFLHTNPSTVEEGYISNGFNYPNRGLVFALYKRSLLSKVKFISGISIAEDSLFNVMFHSMANRCAHSTIPAYCYNYIPESASRSNLRFSEKGFLSYLKGIDELKKFIMFNFPTPTKEQNIFFDAYFLKTINAIIKYNILPEISIRRFKVLNSNLRRNKIEHFSDNLAPFYTFFNYHWTLFFAMVFIKKAGTSIQFRFKKHILKKKSA